MKTQVNVYGLDCTLSVENDHESGVYSSERHEIFISELLEVEHKGQNIDHLFHKNTLNDLMDKWDIDALMTDSEQIVFENELTWDKLEEAAIEEYFKN